MPKTGQGKEEWCTNYRLTLYPMFAWGEEVAMWYILTHPG